MEVGHIKLVSIGCARKGSFGLSGVTISEHVTDAFFGGVSCLKRVLRVRRRILRNLLQKRVSYSKDVFWLFLCPRSA